MNHLFENLSLDHAHLFLPLFDFDINFCSGLVQFVCCTLYAQYMLNIAVHDQTK